MSAMVPAHRQKIQKLQKHYGTKLHKQIKIHSLHFQHFVQNTETVFKSFAFALFISRPLLIYGGRNFANTIGLFCSAGLSWRAPHSSYGIAHYCMVLYDIVWSELANTTFFTSASLNLLLHGIAFYNMILHGIIWYCMLL